MANKMTCPGCDSRTSDVSWAFSQGEPCPHCGLSFVAMAEIIGIRQRQADAELIAKCINMVKELDSVRARMVKAEDKLREIESILSMEDA